MVKRATLVDRSTAAPMPGAAVTGTRLENSESVDVLAHPTARALGRRPPLGLDVANTRPLADLLERLHRRRRKS